MRISRTTALVAVAALATAPLVGCANPLEQLVREGTERVVEEAIERETGVDIDVNTDGGNAALPATFPSELPLPNGRLASTMTIDTGWILTYELADEGAADDLVAWYTGNGFEKIAEMDMGELHTWVFESDAYNATLGLVEDDGFMLQYTVATK